VEFSSNLSTINKKWATQTFQPIFGLLTIFDCNFTKIVAPPSDKSSDSERAKFYFGKKTVKKESKSTNKL